MNAVFEIEVKSQRFCFSYISGQIVPQNSPAIAEAISIATGSWQEKSKLIFGVSKVIRIKQIAA